MRGVLGERSLDVTEEHGWTICRVAAEQWLDSARALHADGGLDYLASLTAVDLKEEFELVAHFLCLSDGRRVALKCRLHRDSPSVPTLSQIWEAADWLERETAEMFGIGFEGHPNLVPLLLPEEWEGHPLRKDYVEPD